MLCSQIIVVGASQLLKIVYSLVESLVLFESTETVSKYRGKDLKPPCRQACYSSAMLVKSPHDIDRPVRERIPYLFLGSLHQIVSQIMKISLYFAISQI